MDKQFWTAPVELVPRMASAELARARDHFNGIPFIKQVLDGIPALVLVVNAQREAVHANRAFIEFTGVDPSKLDCGLRPGELLECAHAHEVPEGCGCSEHCQTCGALEALLEGVKGKAAVRDCRLQRHRNEAADLRVWCTPIDLGSRSYTIFLALDVSTEKRRRVLERIFFHDVLNTAGALRGFAEFLARADSEPLSPAEASDFAGRVFRLSEDLIEEINAQKELAAAESGELPVQPLIIGTRHFLENLAAAHQARCQGRDIAVSLTPDSVDLAFSSDPVLLRRVLGNLVKNAVEASATGDTVALGCRVREDGVEFQVQNPAVMPDRVRLEIFKRSFSTKGEGRGIGTYSIKLLTERYLGGSVDFASAPGVGTSFRVRIPYALPRRPPPGPPPQP